MFNKLSEFWNKYGFEILVVFSLSIILFYGLYRIITKKQGTYSNKYFLEKKEEETENYNTKNNFFKKDSKGEIECRRVLQKIFNKPFLKSRPDFLNNPVTGGNFNLELDCYNQELKLAVEYNGIQHYQYTKFFHRNREHFLNQKYRDDMKRRICKENGITLIEVPYNVKVENIESFLTNKLKNIL